MPKRPDTLVLGAVAYAPKVVTIWEGFKRYFAQRGLQFDYILYSNYETQVEALMDGQCDLAWNSPLAWVRAERLARAQGTQVRALAMRDTDCDLTSVICVVDIPTHYDRYWTKTRQTSTIRADPPFSRRAGSAQNSTL